LVQSGDQKFTTVPNHAGDMPEGTLRAILKQADIKPKIFTTKIFLIYLVGLLNKTTSRISCRLDTDYQPGQTVAYLCLRSAFCRAEPES